MAQEISNSRQIEYTDLLQDIRIDIELEITSHAISQSTNLIHKDTHLFFVYFLTISTSSFHVGPTIHCRARPNVLSIASLLVDNIKL